jgi:hypothetical protein
MEDAEVDRYRGRGDSLERRFLDHISNKLQSHRSQLGVGDAFLGSVPQYTTYFC